MAYITSTELKRYLDISGDGDDILLGECITRAQKSIEVLTGRCFEASTATRFYDAEPPTVSDDLLTLYLDDDSLSVTSITNGDDTAVASTSYVLLPANESPKYAVKLKASKGLVWTYSDDPEQAISVTGSWGYSTTADDYCKQATLRLAGYFYKEKDAQNYETAGLMEGGVMIIPQGLPRFVLDFVRARTRYTFAG